jgi:hypothetical protein
MAASELSSDLSHTDGLQTTTPATPASSSTIVSSAVTSSTSTRTIHPGRYIFANAGSESFNNSEEYVAHIPTISDVDNCVFFQSPALASLFPYLAIHRPTGFLFCSEHCHIAEKGRMIRHYLDNHPSPISASVLAELDKAIKALDLPPDAACIYSETRKDRSSIKGVLV